MHHILLLAFIALTCSACMNSEQERPVSPYQPGERLTSSTGQRIALTRSQKTHVKLRTRPKKRKVYNASLQAVGKISIVRQKKLTTITTSDLVTKKGTSFKIDVEKDRFEVSSSLLLQKRDGDQWMIQTLPNYQTIGILEMPSRSSLKQKRRTTSLRLTPGDTSPITGRLDGSEVEIQQHDKSIFRGLSNHMSLDELLILAHPLAAKDPLQWSVLALTWHTLVHHQS